VQPTRLILLGLALLAGLVVAFVPADRLLAAPGGVREVNLTLSQFAFDPPVVRVNRGDRVILTVQATDVVHGLTIDGHDVALRVVPGTSQRAEFIAERAGKFRLRCSVSCGNLHPFMIGELVVAPNDLYWRAVGLALITAISTLAWLRLGQTTDRADD
jgi:heme/copper-type cytochrome/quinol oxidase subunit 2